MTPGQRLLRRRKAEAQRQKLDKTIRLHAVRLCKSAPFFVDWRDLYQEGWEAAIKALRCYDASRGTQKATWAITTAKGVMQHHIRMEARRRGITGRQWEQNEGEVREVSAQAALAIGKDGMADRVAAKQLVEVFVGELSGVDMLTAQAMLANDETVSGARRVLGRAPGNIHWYKARLRRKLGDVMLRGKHKEGLVL